MKQQAVQYLAFDVHQATVVASLRDEHGKVVMRATVATEAKAILTLVRSAGKRARFAKPTSRLVSCRSRMIWRST